MTGREGAHLRPSGGSVVGLVLATLAFAACGQDPPKHNYKFVEYIAVTGSCYEDHVKQRADYEGSLVHWRDLDEGRDSRYGSVHEVSGPPFERFEKPHKYYPPFTVSFSDLTKEEVSGPVLTLKGISTHLQGGSEYDSTCQLKVTERLDHLPSKQPRGDLGGK